MMKGAGVRGRTNVEKVDQGKTVFFNGNQGQYARHKIYGIIFTKYLVLELYLNVLFLATGVGLPLYDYPAVETRVDKATFVCCILVSMANHSTIKWSSINSSSRQSLSCLPTLKQQ